MRYLVVSDIHGSLPALEKVLHYFDVWRCDMLLLLGDILNYGPRNGLPDGLDAQGVAQLLNKMADNVIAVRGNCDSEVDQMLLDFPIMADYTWVIDEGRKMFITHGHRYNEANMPVMADIFWYGHTHLYKLEKADGKLICNTGSVTFPKAGNPPTFALYDSGRIMLYTLEGKVIDEILL